MCKNVLVRKYLHLRCNKLCCLIYKIAVIILQSTAAKVFSIVGVLTLVSIQANYSIEIRNTEGLSIRPIPILR